MNESMINKVKSHISKEVIDMFSDEYIELLIRTKLDEIKDKTYNFKFIDEDSLKIFKARVDDRLRQTKKRWFLLHDKNKELIKKEVDGYKYILKEDPDKFVDIFEVKGVEELFHKIEKEVFRWQSDSSTLLHRYRYINVKQKRYIEMALNNDIELIIYNELLKKDSKDSVGDVIKQMPDVFKQFPIDYTNKKKVNIEEESLILDDTGKNYIIDTYKIDDTSIFQSLIGMEKYKKDFVDFFMKTMNKFDINILMVLLNMGNKDFFTSRTVSASLRSILLATDRPDNKHNYNMLKESLYKMFFMKMRVIDENKRGFTFQVVDNIEIYKEKNVEYANVVFNIDIIKQVMENKITSLYEKDIRNFKFSISEVLIYTLQRERIRLHTISPKSLKSKMSLNDFRKEIYFPNKKRSQNIKELEKGLGEIMKDRTIFKDFQRVGETFFLEFYPFTERERKDFVLT